MVRTRKQAALDASRAAATAKKDPMDGITFTEIPLAKADRTTPAQRGERTLLDLIDEKRPRDATGKILGEVRNGEGKEEGGEKEEEEEEEDVIGHGTNTVFFVVPLLMLMTSFDVLVHQQYRAELEWPAIIGRTCRGFPVLYAIHYVVHPRRHLLLVRLALLALSVAAGCYIVKAANVWAYYYAMQYAPPLGTLWIWAVVELDLMFTLLSCIGVAGYVWKWGYSIV